VVVVGALLCVGNPTDNPCLGRCLRPGLAAVPLEALKWKGPWSRVCSVASASRVALPVEGVNHHRLLPVLPPALRTQPNSPGVLPVKVVKAEWHVCHQVHVPFVGVRWEGVWGVCVCVCVCVARVACVVRSGSAALLQHV
jgi:hypothetical protein